MSSAKNALQHLVGYHASAAGGPHTAVERAAEAGAKAFAFFTRSSRTWTCPAYKPGDVDKFRAACVKHSFTPDCILPHGTYLSNAGSSLEETQKKSLDAIIDEMQRCYALGLRLYNFHPGSTNGVISVDDCCLNVANVIDKACAAVPDVTVVIETMAGQGGSVGSTLEQIRTIINAVKNKHRVGVCVDTAHIHAAGYDIRNAAGWNTFMESFDRIIGLQYLRGMHLNDSKVPFDSRKDRHEDIGKGYIGISAFRAIMNDSRIAGIPLILETPEAKDGGNNEVKYAAEIKLLYGLVGNPNEANDEPPLKSPPQTASVKKTKAKAQKRGKQVITTTVEGTDATEAATSTVAEMERMGTPLPEEDTPKSQPKKKRLSAKE